MLLKIGIAVLLTAAVYGVIRFVDDYFRKRRVIEQAPLKLVVVVKDQEDGIEFFIRRIMTEGRRRLCGIDVLVVDTGSTDETLLILRRMSNMFGFKLLELNEDEDADRKMLMSLKRRGEYKEVVGDEILISKQPTFYYDARGMSGVELARAPLFQLLSTHGQR
ncbi:hypothetical protein [Desulfolucanica intricata]|uniref:hypothetical protein n=1 Tax=Desulfolucanica intricata TaxID=1285191 RepID=UPI0008333DD6|nr:hypothetical protein [Desulfolucanica intricata]